MIISNHFLQNFHEIQTNKNRAVSPVSTKSSTECSHIKNVCHVSDTIGPKSLQAANKASDKPMKMQLEI